MVSSFSTVCRVGHHTIILDEMRHTVWLPLVVLLSQFLVSCVVHLPVPADRRLPVEVVLLWPRAVRVVVATVPLLVVQ